MKEAREQAMQQAMQQAKALMQKHNPVYVPRNHTVHAALTLLTARQDCTLVRELLTCLQTPFERQERYSRFEQPPQSYERVTQTFCGT